MIRGYSGLLKPLPFHSIIFLQILFLATYSEEKAFLKTAEKLILL